MALSRKSRSKKNLSRRSRKSTSRRNRRHRGGASGASGEQVNLYFKMTNTNAQPVYSDNSKFDITKFTKNSVGTVGVSFPSTTLKGKDFKFKAIKAKATDWNTTMPGQVTSGTNKIVIQNTTGAAIVSPPGSRETGPIPIKILTAATAVNPEAVLQYIPEGVPLNGLKIGGLWSQGFGSTPDSTGAVPPGAPAGTSTANVCVSFTLV